jgi:thiamine-phosphate diphosphorylase/hydroxyethylthiazole kinase
LPVANKTIGLAAAREILGPDAIIGVSAGTAEEAIRACAGGANYIGIGTVYSTQT